MNALKEGPVIVVVHVVRPVVVLMDLVWVNGHSIGSRIRQDMNKP